MKINASQNTEISLSLTDVVYSCPSREFETWQICLLTQFAKIKFSQKFLNLQYRDQLCFFMHQHVPGPDPKDVRNQGQSCLKTMLHRYNCIIQ